MVKKRAVLVTGVASYWGARVATRLIAEPELHIIGLDTAPPPEGIKGLDFIQADIRNPLLVDLLKSEKVQTVCHLAFTESARLSEQTFDFNVMGTLKVMGACVEADVGQVVLKSSTAVYGAQSSNPALLTEEHPLNGSRRHGTTRDLVEIESFCNGFHRQAPQVTLTTLRFPSIIGPTCDTPMTHFLKDITAPVLLGFDPLMQVIHEDDVVGGLAHAVLHKAPGVFNIAADKALPLSQLIALAGKVGVPILHLLAYWTVPLGSHLLAPIEWDYIRYVWVGDLKKMREEFRFTPRYTAAEALREFAAQQRVRQYFPESAALAFDEARLRDTIERRRRAREQGDDHA